MRERLGRPRRHAALRADCDRRRLRGRRPREGRRAGRRRHRRRDPLDRPEPARLRPLRTDDRGLRRHLRDPGELPDHARGDGRVVRGARPLHPALQLLLGPVHVGDRGDGRVGGLRQHGQRRPLRDPLPRHQHRARADRPARLAHDQRLVRRHDQHRRGQLPAHRRRRSRRRRRSPPRSSSTTSSRATRACPTAQIGLGDAFEIDVPVTNGLLYEWAQAQLTRELFPDCPVKYMPPTRHMDGNLFRTHAADTLFNLVTIATAQGIQTIGVPTEGIFTPHIHDRVLGLQNVDYVFNTARDLGEEIEFKPGGIIQTRAQEVLAGAHELLERIAEIGPVRGDRAGDVRRRQPPDRRGPRHRGHRRDRRGLLQPGRRADERRAAAEAGVA